MRRAAPWLLALGMAPALAEAATTVTAVRLGLDPGRTRIVLDLSAPPQFALSELADNGGQQLRLRLDEAAAAPDIELPSVWRTVITQLEMQRSPDALELVLALQSPQASRVFVLKPEGGRGHRLVIDLIDPAPSIAAASEQTTAAEPPPVKRLSAKPEQTVADTAAPRRALPPPPPTAESSDSRLSPRGPDWRFSGTWDHEWAMARGGSAQKFETRIEPRVDGALPGGLRLTGIARLRWDAVGDIGPSDRKPPNYSGVSAPWYNSEHLELSLRELYVDADWGGAQWRLGKQQVVWGQADGIKVLDVVNPQSFREFVLDDFDRSRIPLWMVNVETPLGQDTALQWLVIPDRTYHELPEVGTPYEIRSNRLLPEPPPGFQVGALEPRRTPGGLRGSDYGVRLSSFTGGWDLTLNYLRHYQNFPVPYVDVNLFAPGGPSALLSPEYQRNHLFGATAANAFGSFTLRSEVAYNTDTFHVANDPFRRGIVSSRELASVVGLDWRPSAETFVSAQWFQSHLFDYQASIERDRREQNISLLLRRSFANEVWDVSSLMLYSINHRDSWLQLKLSYLWLGDLRVWLGADLFRGDREGLFGQFRGEDRLLMGLQWSY